MIYLLIPAAVFMLDYFIKEQIEITKEENKPEELWNGRIILRKIYNKGAIFNLGEKKQEFVAGLSTGMGIMAVIGYMALLGRKGHHLLKVGAGLLIGGAASNIYDRLVRKKVIDYFSINTRIERLKKIVFNLSDWFIFLGAGLILIWEFTHKEN